MILRFACMGARFTLLTNSMVQNVSSISPKFVISNKLLFTGNKLLFTGNKKVLSQKRSIINLEI